MVVVGHHSSGPALHLHTTTLCSGQVQDCELLKDTVVSRNAYMSPTKNHVRIFLGQVYEKPPVYVTLWKVKYNPGFTMLASLEIILVIDLGTKGNCDTVN